MNKEGVEMGGEKQSTKKTKYFSDFALKHFSEMKILRRGGILGKENKDWRNISEHCLTEAVGADILAEHLGADRKKLVAAALLHDWYKRHEVEAMKQKGGGEGYKSTAEEDERLLKEFGISGDIIALAHANIPKSADPEYLANRPLEEKIMHYMDMITSGSDFVASYKERLIPIVKNPRNLEFSESFRDKYEGTSLFELQTAIADEEQKEFEQVLGLQAGTLSQFLKDELNKRIEVS